MALVELSVVEQRYRAVLEAAAGVPVTEVAARYEVSRQSVLGSARFITAEALRAFVRDLEQEPSRDADVEVA